VLDDAGPLVLQPTHDRDLGTAEFDQRTQGGVGSARARPGVSAHQPDWAVLAHIRGALPVEASATVHEGLDWIRIRYAPDAVRDVNRLDFSTQLASHLARLVVA
jgi:hypothetical protein